MNWDDLRHFVAFAAAGSLSGAARTLNVEHATIARRIAALEAELQVKLVDRRGRKLHLTPTGAQIATTATQMQLASEQISRHARSAASSLQGDVTISAPPAFAAAVLAGPLTALRRQHPNLNVFISGDIHAVSLDRREADIAIRLSRPEAGDLTVTKLGEMPFRLYGRSTYLERIPEPDWDFVNLGGALSAAPQQKRSETKAPSARSGLSADQIEMQLALVRAGAGVAMLPDFLASKDPELACAKPQAPPFIREVWLIYHSDMKNADTIRAVTGFLKTLQF